MSNSRLISDIEKSNNLKEVISALDTYCNPLTDQQFADEEKITDLIEKEIGNDFIKMQDRDRFIFANKLRKASIYLLETMSQLMDKRDLIDFDNNKEEYNEVTSQIKSLNRKIMIANTMSAHCEPHFLDTANKTLAFNDYMNKVYQDSKNLYSQNIIPQDELQDHPAYMINQDESEIKRYAEPFNFAYGNLLLELEKVENKSRMMRYIHGDAGKNTVKTKSGEEIPSLDSRMKEISDSPLSQINKLHQMEQAVLDIYWQVRRDQGLFNSRLGNTLEHVLNDKNGLALGQKYGVLAIVPKNVNKLQGNAFDLDKIREFQGQDFNNKFQRLQMALDSSHLKTKKHPLIDELITELQEIDSREEEAKVKGEYKIIPLGDDKKQDAMEVAISQKYLQAQKMADSNMFWHQSNLADALKDFMKIEFRKDVGDMKSMVEKYNKKKAGRELTDFSNPGKSR